MLNDYSKHESKNFSILIDEDKLNELHKFLTKNFKQINFKGRTNDNTELKFRSLGELLEQPNHRERKLVKIKIDCQNGGGDEKAGLSISLGNEYPSFSESIKYYFRYDNLDWGFRFDDELNKHLRELKTWYNPLTKFNFIIGFPLFFLMLMIVYFGIDGLFKIYGQRGYFEYEEDNVKKYAYSSYIFLILIFGIGYILEKTRLYLFPRIFIALGKQKNEYLQRKTISYVVFGVIILGIIINLISSLIYN